MKICFVLLPRDARAERRYPTINCLSVRLWRWGTLPWSHRFEYGNLLRK